MEARAARQNARACNCYRPLIAEPRDICNRLLSGDDK
jgi:hypothetical protein